LTLRDAHRDLGCGDDLPGLRAQHPHLVLSGVSHQLVVAEMVTPIGRQKCGRQTYGIALTKDV